MTKSVQVQLTCFSGIFFSYLFYGIYQEKITKTKYGENKEQFNFMMTLIFIQYCTNFVFAFIISLFTGKKNENSSKKSSSFDLFKKSAYYLVCSLSYTGAMFASNKALLYVNYPTQVVGKSIKPIPVLIMTFIFGKASYNLKKFVSVSVITAGVILFLYKKPLFYGIDAVERQATVDVDAADQFYGEYLLAASLFLDGVTASVQERLKKSFRISSSELMSNMNLYSLCVVLPLLIRTNELNKFVEFSRSHPQVISDIFYFAVCSVVGQLFIFYTIVNINPLACSIITTTRKFFTVLFSVILFNNELFSHQWLGVVLVFAGLVLDHV